MLKFCYVLVPERYKLLEWNLCSAYPTISWIISSLCCSTVELFCCLGSGAALCLFNKVTQRAQAEVLRRISRLGRSVRMSLAKATHQVQAMPPVVSTPLR